jgi:hypothetical protein
MIALLWIALHVQPALACAGTSDELRESVLPAVVQGRCEIVLIDSSR